MKKSLVRVSAALLSSGLLVGVAFAQTVVPPSVPGSTQTATSSGMQQRPVIDCTQEAKVCPDGHTVRRLGPSCDFAPCLVSGDQGKGAGEIKRPKPLVLTITDKGEIAIRGSVVSVGTSSFTMKTWGGTWTVTTDSTTEVVPAAISTIAVGDFVGVLGTVSQDGMTVTANYVRNWVNKPTAPQQNKNEKGDRPMLMGSSTMPVMGSDRGDRPEGRPGMGSTTPRGDDFRGGKPPMMGSSTMQMPPMMQGRPGDR